MTSICIITQSVYDVDPRVRRKAEALVAAGYSVDVLALGQRNGKREYALNGVNVYTISVDKARQSLLRYVYEYAAFFIWAFFRVFALTWRKRYAVVDANTLPDFLIFAAAPARWMGATLVLDMHEITPEFYMSKYGVTENSPMIDIVKYLEQISFDYADRVITINEPIQDLLVSRGMQRSKSIVVMNAANEERFGSSLHAPARKGDGNSDTFVMMYHGTLTGIYGLDIAIEAFSKVHTQMPGAELWILGSGPEEAALERLARGHGLTSKARLLGTVPHAEMPKMLEKCDVGILPMRGDVFLNYAFPNKLPEFAIMGKPVLMSRLKAIHYYFGEDSLAYFEPNDPADLARQMVRLYQDRALCARLAANAKKDYEPIRWGVMKDRYLKLIGEIVGPERSAVESQTSEPREPTAVER